MWANGWGNGNINQIVDVAPNETYTLTALAKGGIREKEGTLAATMFIEEMQDREKKTKVEIASDLWETYSLDYTTSPDCRQIRIVFQTESGKWGEHRSPFEIDNVFSIVLLPVNYLFISFLPMTRLIIYLGLPLTSS